MIVGSVAGIISCLGFTKFKAFVWNKFGLHDSCGILWLHGVPGLIGGISGAIFAQ